MGDDDTPATIKNRLLETERFKSACQGTSGLEGGDDSVEGRIVRLLAHVKSKAEISSRLMQVMRHIPFLYEAQEGLRKSKRHGDLVDVILAADSTRYRCRSCGNDDFKRFQYDKKSGQVACLGVEGERSCGMVIVEQDVFEGNMYRKFSDGVDKSHHGPALDPLFSSAWNSRTTFGGTGKRATELNKAMRDVEMGLSNIGQQTKGTRQGFKDEEKLKAFRIMDEAAISVGVHDLVTQRAKSLFAAYRDYKEAVQDRDGVVAACMIAAFYETVLLETNKTSLKQEDLEPFVCPSCGFRHNSTRGMAAHHCEGQVQKRKLLTSDQLTDYNILKMDLKEIEAFLKSYKNGMFQFSAATICAHIKQQMEKMNRSNNNDSDDDRSNASKNTMTAGQFLSMKGLKQLTIFCNNDEKVGRQLHQELQALELMRRKKAKLMEDEERDRKRAKQTGRDPILAELQRTNCHKVPSS